MSTQRPIQRTLGFSLCLGLCLNLCVDLSSSWGAVSAILVDENLTEQPITLQSLSRDTLVFFDAQRVLRRKSLQRLLQIRSLAGRSPSVALPTRQHAWLEWVDGQRLVGRWDESSPIKSEIVPWSNPIVGLLQMPLDQVRRIRFAEANPSENNQSDRLRFTNGDQMRGFITSVGRDEVQIEPTDQTDGVAIEINRVAMIELANTEPSSPLNRYMVWLVDGSRLRVEKIEIQADRVTLYGTDFKQPLQLPLRELVHINFTGQHRKIIPLSQLTHRVEVPSNVFGHTFQPVLQDQLILLHSPMQLDFDLPKGACRFAGEATVYWDSIPVAKRGWVDFEVEISVDGQTIWKQHFHDAVKAIRINEPVEGNVLTIKIHPGRNGPVLDRLRLNHPVVLVQVGSSKR